MAMGCPKWGSPSHLGVAVRKRVSQTPEGMVNTTFMLSTVRAA